ncbi:MAG: UTP--glucose-1-phosphate uridylyltransferase, partial [Bacilli bacterium]
MEANASKKNDLFRFYNELDEEHKKELTKQINTIDFNFMDKLYQNSFTDEIIDIKNIKPLNYVNSMHINDKYKYKLEGKKIVENSNYSIVLLAGGIGSRLMHFAPKGTFMLDIKGEKISIFELLINRVKNCCKASKTKIPIYIMTSIDNHIETKQ